MKQEVLSLFLMPFGGFVGPDVFGCWTSLPGALPRVALLRGDSLSEAVAEATVSAAFASAAGAVKLAGEDSPGTAARVSVAKIHALALSTRGSQAAIRTEMLFDPVRRLDSRSVRVNGEPDSWFGTSVKLEHLPGSRINDYRKVVDERNADWIVQRFALEPNFGLFTGDDFPDRLCVTICHVGLTGRANRYLVREVECSLRDDRLNASVG